MSRLLRFIAALLPALALVAGAQEVPRLKVCLYAFGYAPGLEDVHLRTGPEAFTKVELSTANIVGPVTALAPDGKITLHGPPETNAQGETVYPVVATATIPGGLRRALVVLLPDAADAAAPYRTLVLEHDAAGFPLGTYRLINLSTHPIRGAVGRTVVQAKPGGLATLALEGDPGAVLPVRFEYREGERWNRLTETRCAVRKDRRWLMCVYRDPKSGRLNIRSIPDRTVTPVGGEG